jgi:hypothetical protein
MVRKSLTVALALVMVLAAVMAWASVVVAGKPTRTPVTAVELNHTSLYLDVGGAGTLEATITPLDAFNQRVTWSTSNRAVAKLSGHGLTRTVTGVQPGTSVIIVTTADGGYTATCLVAVQTPLTGIGSIIGAPVVGVTLTAGALTPAEGTATYQWQRADTLGGSYSNIGGATVNTYQLVGTDWQKYIRVVATGSGSFKGTVTSNPTSQVKLPLTAIGAINGTAEVGETLTAGALTPADADVTYQWQRSGDGANGWMYISGANSNTYQLGAADWQMYIRVSATGTGLYTGTVTSVPTVQITSTGIDLTAIGDITGDPIVWETLYAGALTPEEATADYQWQKSDDGSTGWTDIEGETGTNHHVVEDDWQKYVRLKATGYGLYTGTVYSQPTSMVLMPLAYIYDPEEAPVVGVTLTAGDIWPVGATVSYQWQGDNGTGWLDIAGATGSTYVVSEDDLDKYVRVSANGTGVYTGTVSSYGIGPVTATAELRTIGPINGISMVGQTLTAGGLFPKGATASYQWQISSDNGTTYIDIPGANSSTYELDEADAGNLIQVTANGTAPYTGTVTSAYPVRVLGTAVTLPFTEGFSDFDWYSALPAGWGQIYSPVFYDSSQNEGLISIQYGTSANGTSPELYFEYGPFETRYYDYRAVTPSINTTGASYLTLSFKHYYDFWGPELPNSMAVEVSADNGATWVPTSWVISSPTANIGPEIVQINLNAYAGQTILISWRWYQYTYYGDYWCIDDISLYDPSPVPYTVTFNETNAVSDVSIDVWDDEWNYIDYVTTNSSGEATIQLPDGDYYYDAYCGGFAEVYDEPFSVSGTDTTVDFEMVPYIYTVTFEVVDADTGYSLSGVGIEIYDYDEDPIDTLYTDYDGEATIELPDDDYYYDAGCDGYIDIYDGYFTVSGTDTTVGFEMVPYTYTVTFEATDGNGGAPVEDVPIEIYDYDGNWVDTVYTDSYGEATVELRTGSYYYDVTSPPTGYHYTAGKADFDVYSSDSTEYLELWTS